MSSLFVNFLLVLIPRHSSNGDNAIFIQIRLWSCLGFYFLPGKEENLSTLLNKQSFTPQGTSGYYRITLSSHCMQWHQLYNRLSNDYLFDTSGQKQIYADQVLWYIQSAVHCT